MKKILCFFTATLLIFSMFGCSKSNTASGDKSASENSTSDIEKNIMSGTIPSGGVYICADKTVLTTGDDFPVPQKGDIFQYNNYRYGFEKKFNKEINAWEEKEEYKDAWSVHVLDENKETIGVAITELNGKKVIIPNNLYEKTNQNKETQKV